MTRSCEPHRQAAVRLLGHLLQGVKGEFAGDGGGLGGEAPDHLAEFRLGVVAAEGAGGMGGQVEGRIALKAGRFKLGRGDAVQPEMPHAPVAAGLARDQIAAHAE